ncbi:MexE family multidrug efflux RND transporter periplasmic adaptor subunit [Geobacter hydrogenophilus]|uniref:MexE family multidrug efflux RND transporter periplasmic adaptor subunit n=1 Tax=Geobacter hydrogenophilus TaxID=40983 RepID=A0A9W6G1U7_9BACT|nr:MexE family multidrug efflux RND transporter periplasmic adaptor subunit [Geobacter hydrogenophilus]
MTVSHPVKREVTDYLELTGNTQAVNSVQLVARVPGYLEKVFFRDGQMVNNGQPLFQIQRNTYEASLRQAEGQVMALRSQLEYAEGQLIRYSNLLPHKAATQTDVDNWRYQRDSARANLKAAEANRDLARLNLGYTLVSAPFSGRIDRRQQDPGNLVGSETNNSVLAQLIQINPIYVYFTVSDLDLARLLKSNSLPGVAKTEKRPVFIALAQEEGYSHKGYVDFAATSLTPTTGTLLLRGVFRNPSGRILPGLYAKVRLPLERRVALLIPDTAVRSDQQGSYVLTVNGKNTVERRAVKVGHQEDSLRVIEQGLDGNEWVIVKGQLKAPSGSRVTPVREDAEPASTPSRTTAEPKVKP